MAPASLFSSCPLHGRRPAWLVCEHLFGARDAALGQRVVWMYDGATGATLEYRVCDGCARRSSSLRRASVSERAPRDPLHERVRALCSSCGVERLAPPTRAPLLLEH